MLIHAWRHYSVADPKTEHISKLVHSKTTKTITISFILHPCHILLCTPTSLTLCCSQGREDGWLHTASPAGSWGRRAGTKAAPDPQITPFTASIMVDEIPNGKLHPSSGIRPVGKGGEEREGKGQIMWATWFTRSPEATSGELQKYWGTW